MELEKGPPLSPLSRHTWAQAVAAGLEGEDEDGVTEALSHSQVIPLNQLLWLCPGTLTLHISAVEHGLPGGLCELL